MATIQTVLVQLKLEEVERPLVGREAETWATVAQRKTLEAGSLSWTVLGWPGRLEAPTIAH